MFEGFCLVVVSRYQWRNQLSSADSCYREKETQVLHRLPIQKDSFSIDDNVLRLTTPIIIGRL